MKKNRKVILIVLIGLLIISTGCSKKEKKQTDSERFAEEYTSLNGTKSESGKTIRILSISKDNPFIYATDEEIVKKIEKKESFIVYFGFPTCPWCRSILEELIKAAKDKEIDKIYYVNVLDIRDIKEIDDEGNINTTKEGTMPYKRLIEELDNVLEEYTLKKDDETINAGEKRIYAPNVVAISKGKAIQLETGISEELKDPYGKLTKEMKEYSYNKFKCLMECLEAESTTCQKNSC